MAENLVTPNPEDTSAATPVVPDSSKEEVAETPDWKALYEAEKAKASKAENDKKAIQGARRKADDQDSLLQEILTRLESGEKANAALVRALASQDTEALSGELTTIQSEAAQVRAATRFQTQYKSVYESIIEDAQDDEGKSLVDLEKDERLQAFREEVVAGYKKGSIADIVNALPKFHRVIRQIERENAKSAVAKAKEEAEVTSNKKLKSAGLGDHDLGAPAAGSGNSANLYGKSKIARGLEQDSKRKNK